MVNIFDGFIPKGVTFCPELLTAVLNHVRECPECIASLDKLYGVYAIKRGIPQEVRAEIESILKGKPHG
jgi:hypothetical protein